MHCTTPEQIILQRTRRTQADRDHQQPSAPSLTSRQSSVKTGGQRFCDRLATVPACKYNDQADSTSQALDWAKQNTQTYGLFEYYRQLRLKSQLHLPDGYEFVQCDDDEPITAIQDGTGHTIVWTKDGWVGYRIVKQEDKS